MKIAAIQYAIFNKDESDMTDDQMEKITDHLIDHCEENGMMIGGTAILADGGLEDPFLRTDEEISNDEEVFNED